MKKLISLLLTGLMAFSAVSAGAVSASAATTYTLTLPVASPAAPTEPAE